MPHRQTSDPPGDIFGTERVKDFFETRQCFVIVLRGGDVYIFVEFVIVVILYLFSCCGKQRVFFAYGVHTATFSVGRGIFRLRRCSAASHYLARYCGEYSKQDDCSYKYPHFLYFFCLEPYLTQIVPVSGIGFAYDFRIADDYVVSYQ